MAGVQGARHCLLPGRLADARAAVARRHGVDLWRPRRANRADRKRKCHRGQKDGFGSA